MKLDTYEVPVGTDGRTLRVSTINVFSGNDVILDNGVTSIKKIKTKKFQIENAKEEFSNAILLNSQNVELVNQNPIEEQTKIISSDIGHKYSFESSTNDSFESDRLSVANPYQRQSVSTATNINDFNQHIHKMTRLSQLQEDYKNLNVGTWRYKTTAKAIEILEDCKNKKDEQESIINNFINERTAKTKEYEMAIKNLEERFKAYMEEVNMKIAEAEKTKASIQKFEDARIIEINTSLKNAADADKKEAEANNLVKGIIIDIESAETKKHIQNTNSNAFNKFKSIENESEIFDLQKGGRVA